MQAMMKYQKDGLTLFQSVEQKHDTKFSWYDNDDDNDDDYNDDDDDDDDGDDDYMLNEDAQEWLSSGLSPLHIWLPIHLLAMLMVMMLLVYDDDANDWGCWYAPSYDNCCICVSCVLCVNCFQLSWSLLGHCGAKLHWYRIATTLRLSTLKKSSLVT